MIHPHEAGDLSALAAGRRLTHEVVLDMPLQSAPALGYKAGGWVVTGVTQDFVSGRCRVTARREPPLPRWAER